MLDKSKGYVFTRKGIKFYRGLYSEGSYCGQLSDGRLLYLSGIMCKMDGVSPTFDYEMYYRLPRDKELEK